MKIPQEVTVRWLRDVRRGRLLELPGRPCPSVPETTPVMKLLGLRERCTAVFLQRGLERGVLDKEIEQDLSSQQGCPPPFLHKEGQSTVAT